jgi:hypothetical protein
MSRRRLFLGLLLSSVLVLPARAGLLDQLPTDATVVGFVDLRAVAGSKVLGGLAQLPGVGDQLGGAGIAGAGPLDSFAIAAWGSLSALGGESDFMAVATGQFEPAALRASLLERGAVEVGLPGGAALRLPAQEGGPAIYARILVDDLLQFGTRGSYERLADQGKAASVGPSLLEARAYPHDAAAWLVASDLGELTGQGGAASQFAVLSSLEVVGLIAKVDSGLILEARGRTTTPEAAAQLTAMLQFLPLALGMAAQQGGENAALAEVIAGLTVRAEDHRVFAGLTIGPAQLESLASVLSQLPATSGLIK